MQCLYAVLQANLIDKSLVKHKTCICIYMYVYIKSNYLEILECTLYLKLQKSLAILGLTLQKIHTL